MTESRKRKRKVNLVSSHSDRDSEDGPELYKNSGIPSFMRYLPKAGETVVYEEIYIPDVVDS